MFSPQFQLTIYKQEERELLREIELQRKLKQRGLHSLSLYSQIMSWLNQKASSLKSVRVRRLQTTCVTCGCTC
jgi:hypothetical protein